jgi:hypothetical protein
MRRAAIVSVAALLMSCGIAGSGEEKQGSGDQSQWTLTATLSRPNLTVQHGSTDTTTLIITRGGGFTGDVQIASIETPGITTVISTPVTVGSVTTAKISVTPGTASDVVYTIPIPLQIDSKVDNLNSHLDLSLNVTRKNGFWTTAPTTMSVARGGASGPTRVTFTKTGFTDDVTMSLPLFNGAPAGITATFSPNPIVGDTVTSMTILIDSSVPEGSYSVGVRCNGGGYQGTAPLTITVTAAAGLSMNAVTNPVLVARGGQSGTLINLVRTNLTAGITPTVTSTLPAGVTVTFGPPTSFGPTISMNVATTLAATPGTFTVSVTSGGVGVPLVTIPITVTISP